MQIFGSREPEAPPSPRRVLLDFGDVEHAHAGGKDLRDGLSVAARVGPNLFVATDEGGALERLSTRDGSEFRGHVTFPLAELLDLPAGGEEVDVEGMDYREPYLWLVGSHSLKRKKPDPAASDPAAEIERLARIVDEDNRYLLARIPLERDPATGEHTPRRGMPDPADPGRTLTAARLKGEGRKGSQLMKALRGDPHLGPFSGVPGKDNGLDVEGLALVGERVFLGLRGPVLRGWATILEVEPAETKDPSRLKLRRIGPEGRRFRKHFLDLGGLGIRELSTDGPDLLVLAGPTLDLDGPVTLFRWLGGCRPDGEALVGRDRIRKVADVPYGQGRDAGRDHPEGITLFRDPGEKHGVLVVYDSPAERRKEAGGRVRADLLPLPAAGG